MFYLRLTWVVLFRSQKTIFVLGGIIKTYWPTFCPMSSKFKTKPKSGIRKWLTNFLSNVEQIQNETQVWDWTTIDQLSDQRRANSKRSQNLGLNSDWPTFCRTSSKFKTKPKSGIGQRLTSFLSNVEQIQNEAKIWDWTVIDQLSVERRANSKRSPSLGSESEFPLGENLLTHFGYCSIISNARVE